MKFCCSGYLPYFNSLLNQFALESCLIFQAISAVDLALWDLLGKLRKEPVYALLGGKTKDRLSVYSTTARPDKAKEFGFVGAKIPCPYGPSEGDEGLRKNVEFFKVFFTGYLLMVAIELQSLFSCDTSNMHVLI